jgi:hypothetical protein
MFGVTESCQISTTGFAGTSESPDHYEKNKMEKEFVLCRVKELFGSNPEGSFLRWEGYPHDFGTYYELTLKWRPGNEKLEQKCYDWINKIEDHDWEKEQEQLESQWDIQNMKDLDTDNEVFNHLELN